MRKFPQKADGIGEQYPLFVRQNKTARGRIESGEKFILGHHVGTSEQIQKGRFTGVGVTDDRGNRPLMPLPALPLDRTRFANRFELPLQSRDSLLDPAAVDFQLSLAWAASADSTSLPRQVMPHSGQSRQKIL